MACNFSTCEVQPPKSFDLLVRRADERLLGGETALPKLSSSWMVPLHRALNTCGWMTCCKEPRTSGNPRLVVKVHYHSSWTHTTPSSCTDQDRTSAHVLPPNHHRSQHADDSNVAPRCPRYNWKLESQCNNTHAFNVGCATPRK